MKKISYEKSLQIVEELFRQLKKSVNNNKNEFYIEYFELVIDDIIYEKCECSYIQLENKMEAILFEPIMSRFFYIKSELINESENKFVQNLYILDHKVSSVIPKKLKDKMFSIFLDKKDIKIENEDFVVKFSLVKPRD